MTSPLFRITDKDVRFKDGAGKPVRKYEYEGKKYSLAELSKKFDLNRYTIFARLKKGWTMEQAVETPAGYPHK